MEIIAKRVAVVAALALTSVAAASEAVAELDTGTTAWMLTAAVLGLMMTVPGVAMFYGGMVRRKNMLSIAGQCFAICCVISVVWIFFGYSLAFSGEHKYIGNFDLMLLRNMDHQGLKPNSNFPESVYIVFQLGFAIVAGALITGAVADRIRFSGLLIFIGLWSLLVYAPVVHWIWGGGFLKDDGVLDFAGGTIVHINAGVAGLIACIVVGKRSGYGAEDMSPHNPLFSVIGVSLLWIGWFGFSAGSALSAGTLAGTAMLLTQTSAAAGALAWIVVEWMMAGKPSVLGMVSGAVAGLVAITPAAGYVYPGGAIVIGFLAGMSCCWACSYLKYKLKYDDSLDVFGIHGIGGLVGAILTGVFAQQAIGGADGWVEGNYERVWTQVKGVGVVALWSAGGTALILGVLRIFMRLRVTEEDEMEGLDYTQHGEIVGGS